MQVFYGLKVSKMEKNKGSNTVGAEPERYSDTFFWILSLLTSERHHLVSLQP